MDYMNLKDYGESTNFISSVKQITNSVDDFKETNEKAIDRQTEQSKQNFSGLFSLIRKIFMKGDESETYYDMVQRESDETQAKMDKMDTNATTSHSGIANAIKNLRIGS